MNNFNPFLPPPSPYRQQNQCYVGPPQNFYGGGYQAPGYTPAYPSYSGPDAWAQPGYPGQYAPPTSGYTPGPAPSPGLRPAQQPCSGPPNPNVYNCNKTQLALGGSGAATGAWKAGQWAATHCPPTPAYPYCVGGVAGVGAGMGGFGGHVAAINSPACQDVFTNGRGGTCTNTDPNHRHFANHVER